MRSAEEVQNATETTSEDDSASRWINAAVAALREAATDTRVEVRRVSVPTLAGLGDRTTLDTIEAYARQGLIPGAVRSTRSTASATPEGPEEKIAIEVRGEPGDNDEGRTSIRYENESVTLAGEGRDEETAL